jgi:hypothetical protein
MENWKDWNIIGQCQNIRKTEIIDKFYIIGVAVDIKQGTALKQVVRLPYFPPNDTNATNNRYSWHFCI